MYLVGASIFLLCVTIINATSSQNYFKDVYLPEKLPTNLQDYVLANNPKLSNDCSKQVDLLKQDLSPKDMKRWAFEMFDAATKIPTGIASGSAGDLGNFDQCLNVHWDTNDTGPIDGKYCMGTLPFLSLTFAACLPATCTAADIQAIYRNTIKFSESSCQTKESQPSLDAVAIFTIAFLGIIAVIMLLSTIYDVFNYYSKRKPRHSLLVAFSIFTNGNKLLAINNNPNQISCLHGIRTISMMWIILGHRYKILYEVRHTNRLEILEWPSQFINSYLTGAAVSVDSFLLMSGIVISYSFMGAMKKGIKFNLLMFYLHRYLRLTPAYAAVILINVSLMKHLGSGPQWPELVGIALQDNCKKYWWSALLYVQNYVNPEEPCMRQSWYLSVDTQLFVLSPLLLIPFLKWPKLKFYVLPALAFAAALTTFLICWFEELYLFATFIEPDRPEKAQEYVNKAYYPTHTRASPWIVGLTTGYIIYALKDRNFVRMFGVMLTSVDVYQPPAKNCKTVVYSAVDFDILHYRFQKLAYFAFSYGVYLLMQHHLMSAILWIGSMLVLCSCVFGSNFLIDLEVSLLAQTIYTAFTPFGWAIGLSCMILLCVHGYGGPVNWILSNPLMQIVSKFTYSMYLLHKVVISSYVYSARTLLTFSNFEVLHSFWGDFIYTFALSVIWVLAFESPIIIIEKVLLGQDKEKKPLPRSEKAPIEPNKQP